MPPGAMAATTVPIGPVGVTARVVAKSPEPKSGLRTTAHANSVPSSARTDTVTTVSPTLMKPATFTSSETMSPGCGWRMSSSGNLVMRLRVPLYGR